VYLTLNEYEGIITIVLNKLQLTCDMSSVGHST